MSSDDCQIASQQTREPLMTLPAIPKLPTL